MTINTNHSPSNDYSKFTKNSNSTSHIDPMTINKSKPHGFSSNGFKLLIELISTGLQIRTGSISFDRQIHA